MLFYAVFMQRYTCLLASGQHHWSWSSPVSQKWVEIKNIILFSPLLKTANSRLVSAKASRIFQRASFILQQQQQCWLVSCHHGGVVPRVLFMIPHMHRKYVYNTVVVQKLNKHRNPTRYGLYWVSECVCQEELVLATMFRNERENSVILMLQSSQCGLCATQFLSK